jgi:steroid delta-isomerase-like uncharacterized protein
MTTEQNKALAQRLIEEVFNQGSIGAVDALLAPGFVEREELPPGVPRDREGVKMLATMLRGAFPDFRAIIEDVIAEGDQVVIRQTWTGTHGGDFMGLPPTGRRVSFPVIDILRMADGQCVEHWGIMDSMGLMQQLGAGPGA